MLSCNNATHTFVYGSIPIFGQTANYKAICIHALFTYNTQFTNKKTIFIHDFVISLFFGFDV